MSIAGNLVLPGRVNGVPGNFRYGYLYFYPAGSTGTLATGSRSREKGLAGQGLR